MPSLLAILLAFAGGLMFSIQTVLNADLGRRLESPVHAAFISFAVGTAALLAAVLIRRDPPAAGVLAGLPWYSWIGGLLGAAYVVIVIVATPRLGAAVVIGLAIAGQLLGSIALDHLGILGLPEHPVNPWRLLGAAMLTGGVLLIRLF
jgi:transporter family-2 protein